MLFHCLLTKDLGISLDILGKKVIRIGTEPFKIFLKHTDDQHKSVTLILIYRNLRASCRLFSYLFIYRALLLSMPGMALVFIISGFVGVVMYAFYAECYPVGYKLITKPDQVSTSG